MKKSNLLHCYQNGNYNVSLYSDGTKIRFSLDDEFKPVFPESIDVKITNKCDNNCKMCHENSNIDGMHGNLNSKFFSSLPRGIELALGGGNCLLHPDLFSFLKRMKTQGVICNMTINQHHFKKNLNLIKQLLDEKLIYGLGISVCDMCDVNDIISFCDEQTNCVIHIIAGAIDYNVLTTLYDHNLKVLILGYKIFGRGEEFYSDNVRKNIDFFRENILDISKHFSIVSFDNRAVKLLNIESKFENFDKFYMGDDGEFTMYIDLVNQKFAQSSTSYIRYDLKDSILEMFKVVQNEKRKYQLKYYLNKTLYANADSTNYTLRYNSINNTWEKSNFDIIKSLEDNSITEVDPSSGIFIANFNDPRPKFYDFYSIEGDFKKEKEVSKSQEFIENMTYFVCNKYKYLPKDFILNLRCSSLDEAYGFGMRELLDEIYLDVNRESDLIKIEKTPDDYIIHFNEDVFDKCK